MTVYDLEALLDDSIATDGYHIAASGIAILLMPQVGLKSDLFFLLKYEPTAQIAAIVDE